MRTASLRRMRTAAHFRRAASHTFYLINNFLQWGQTPLHRLKIASRNYFTKIYLTPLKELGLIASSDPESPNSPRQKCIITKEGQCRISGVMSL